MVSFRIYSNSDLSCDCVISNEFLVVCVRPLYSANTTTSLWNACATSITVIFVYAERVSDCRAVQWVRKRRHSVTHTHTNTLRVIAMKFEGHFAGHTNHFDEMDTPHKHPYGVPSDFRIFFFSEFLNERDICRDHFSHTLWTENRIGQKIKINKQNTSSLVPTFYTLHESWRIININEMNGNNNNE